MPSTVTDRFMAILAGDGDRGRPDAAVPGREETGDVDIFTVGGVDVLRLGAAGKVGRRKGSACGVVSSSWKRLRREEGATAGGGRMVACACTVKSSLLSLGKSSSSNGG